MSTVKTLSQSRLCLSQDFVSGNTLGKKQTLAHLQRSYHNFLAVLTVHEDLTYQLEELGAQGCRAENLIQANSCICCCEDLCPQNPQQCNEHLFDLVTACLAVPAAMILVVSADLWIFEIAYFMYCFRIS